MSPNVIRWTKRAPIQVPSRRKPSAIHRWIEKDPLFFSSRDDQNIAEQNPEANLNATNEKKLKSSGFQLVSAASPFYWIITTNYTIIEFKVRRFQQVYVHQFQTNQRPLSSNLPPPRLKSLDIFNICREKINILYTFWKAGVHELSNGKNSRGLWGWRMPPQSAKMCWSAQGGGANWVKQSSEGFFWGQSTLVGKLWRHFPTQSIKIGSIR